jgi:hypothetical protein
MSFVEVGTALSALLIAEQTDTTNNNVFRIDQPFLVINFWTVYRQKAEERKPFDMHKTL